MIPIASYPQGTFEFSGGIPDTAVLSFRVTANHGMQPALFHVKMTMLPDVPDKNGDVTISYGPFKRVFRNCTIDYIERSDPNKLEWSATLLDRRYLWRFAVISGTYNARWKNGTELRDETQKTPAELASLCLAAMGEKNANLAALKRFSNLDFPQVEWDNTDAANALAELCERYGCRPVFDNDQVAIVNVGDGEELDVSGNRWPVVEDSETFNPPEKPGTIVVRFAPTSIQADLPLIPVGVDTDGTIKPINQLSYMPPPGTEAGPPKLDYSTGMKYIDAVKGLWNCTGDDGWRGIPSPYLRQLAEDNIYKLYAISPPPIFLGLNKSRGDAANDKALPNLEPMPLTAAGTMKDVWWIALQNEQNDRVGAYADPKFGAAANPLQTQFDEYNREVSSAPLPAMVYGSYWFSSLGNNLAGGLQSLNPAFIVQPTIKGGSTAPGWDDPNNVERKIEASGYCGIGFSIISEWSLVKFSTSVWQGAAVKDSGVVAKFSDGTKIADGISRCPPTLWLRTRFFLRDPYTRAFVRAERRRVLDPNNPSVRVVMREDLQLKMTYRYGGAPDLNGTIPRFAPTGREWNWNAVSAAADVYLDEIEREYHDTAPRGVVYAGFVDVSLDGAIRSIDWYVGEDGHAYTRVGRDTDYLVWHQDFSERRLAERVRARINQQPSPAPAPRGQNQQVF